MRTFFDWVTSRPKRVLCGAAALAIALGVCSFGLYRDTSPDAFIPAGHPALQQKEEVESAFGLVEPIAVGIVREAPGGVFEPHTLKLIDEVTRAIQGLPEVEPGRVLSLTTESGIYFEDGQPGFDRLVAEIPTTAEAAGAIRRDVLGYELYRGTLVAEDGRAACILIRPSDEQQADAIYRAVRDLLDGYTQGDTRLWVAGEAAVRAHMGAAVSDDALRMNFVCPVVMALLIFLAYRTLRGTLLPLCVIGGASLAALGLMALFRVPVYIITNGIFVVIMAVGVADGMHILGQYYEEQLDLRGRGRREMVVDACTALWYPVLMTSLTDVAGFFSLYLVGVMPPIRYFGLFTCLGVVGALIYSYLVIPAGLAILPLRSCKAISKPPVADASRSQVDFLGSVIGHVGRFAYRQWRSVLLLSAGLIVAAGYGASQLTVNDARILAFKPDHAIVQATHALNARFDGTSHLNIVLTAAERGALVQPASLQKIEQLEAFTETLAEVGGTHSLAGWVKRAHQKMHNEDPAYYAIPEDPAEAQYYLDVLSQPTSPMAQLLREIVDPTYTETNLIVRMQSSQFVHQRPVIEALEVYLERHFSDGPLRAQLAGRVHLDYQWLRMVRTSHIRSVCLTSLCVFLLTALMFRSLLAGCLCTLTVGLAVLVNYAIMGWGNIPLGVGTAMFASIAIGGGVDFPIHILHRLQTSFRENGGSDEAIFQDTFTFTGRALFFTTMVVTVGFLLLCISEFRTLVRFGLLIGTGMLVSFLASITVLPAVLAALKPRFIWGGRQTE